MAKMKYRGLSCFTSTGFQVYVLVRDLSVSDLMFSDSKCRGLEDSGLDSCWH